MTTKDNQKIQTKWNVERIFNIHTKRITDVCSGCLPKWTPANVALTEVVVECGLLD